MERVRVLLIYYSKNHNHKKNDKMQKIYKNSNLQKEF